LITTSGRKAVIGRPILYKTTKEFLLRFGLKDVGELPSMEEFEKLVAESFQGDLLAVGESANGEAQQDSPRPASHEVSSKQVRELAPSGQLDPGENDPAA
jgi:segregation and condensation protein B